MLSGKSEGVKGLTLSNSERNYCFIESPKITSSHSMHINNQCSKSNYIYSNNINSNNNSDNVRSNNRNSNSNMSNNNCNNVSNKNTFIHHLDLSGEVNGLDDTLLNINDHRVTNSKNKYYNSTNYKSSSRLTPPSLRSRDENKPRDWTALGYQWLSRLSVIWFWVTISGTFLYGTLIVLPEFYGSSHTPPHNSIQSSTGGTENRIQSSSVIIAQEKPTKDLSQRKDREFSLFEKEESRSGASIGRGTFEFGGLIDGVMMSVKSSSNAEERTKGDEDSNVTVGGNYVLWLHYILASFLLMELILNWISVRRNQSMFDPWQFKRYILEHEREILTGGFEIDLNQLITRSHAGSNAQYSSSMSSFSGSSTETTSYTIPLTGVRSLDGNPAKRWTHGTMYIMDKPPPTPTGCSDWPTADNSYQSKKVVYPYWAWKPCQQCKLHPQASSLQSGLSKPIPGESNILRPDVLNLRPPRSHHCSVCGVCVLKRDHHCFFTGCCIGVKNQRHFIVFIFWASVSIAYSLLHALLYIYQVFLHYHTIWDIFPPVTWVQWWLGNLKLEEAVMGLILYSLIWFQFTAAALLWEQKRIVTSGVTSFEAEHKIRIKSRSGVSGNISGVFGRRLHGLNFLIPLHWVYPTMDDGVNWSHMECS